LNILLLGSGGRESALAWKLRQSHRCAQLFIAPGNGGTEAYGHNVPLKPSDFGEIARFALQQRIDMVVVGPEDPLVMGIRDFFRADPALHHIALIGPSKMGAQLEGSKSWAKDFMQRHHIPTASHRTFTTETMEEGLMYIEQHPMPVVLKADGLAAGKGVVICHKADEAQAAFQEMLSGQFGNAGKTIVVEQFLSGIEYSVFVLTDGTSFRILPEAKDYKRIGEGDTGPNTGGMGAVSPVPFVDRGLWQKTVQRIIRPTIKGLAAEQIEYKGFIFFGLIRVGADPYVIEYNCRMGDPETEVVMPRLRSDLVSLLLHCHQGTLHKTRVHIDPRTAATIMMVSGGYPGTYTNGHPIHGLDQAGDSLVFHAGTIMAETGPQTNGGRVLAVTHWGKHLPEALQGAYHAVGSIQFKDAYYRRDIGQDLLRD
jgi:phosphoribosylamine--glycine ligase